MLECQGGALGEGGVERFWLPKGGGCFCPFQPQLFNSNYTIKMQIYNKCWEWRPCCHGNWSLGVGKGGAHLHLLILPD